MMLWRKAKKPEEQKNSAGSAPEPRNASDPALPTLSSGRRKRIARLVRVGWLLVVLLWILPTILLAAAGSWWLWQEGWLWRWLGLTGIVSLVGWMLAQWLRRSSRDTWDILVSPDSRWSPQDEAAWKKVEQLAVRLQQSNLPLDQPEPILRAFYEVLATVARHYRPDSDRPELEIPAPHVLRIVELVASDLRRTLTERVPGVHWLTLHDFYKLSRLAAWFQRFYTWFYGGYRVVQLAANPAAALMREVRDAALGQVQVSTTEEIKEGAISFCVRQAGKYAIQLYSGKVLLQDQAGPLPPTRTAIRQVEKSAQQSRLLEEEPLRMLVLGGMDSGKSSLVPLLWGLVPPKRPVWKKLFSSQPIPRNLWRPEGLPPILITDWPAYDRTPPSPKLLAAFEQEILQTDFVLLVCSREPETWSSDRQWLDQVRTIYQQHPERNRPALVVVVTEKEGPQEVSPQLQNVLGQPASLGPSRSSFQRLGPSGASTRGMDQNLYTQLGLNEAVSVVSVWLKPDQREAIQKKICETFQQVLSEAERARYTRYYAQFHREERWPQLWEQIRHTAPEAGKILVQQAPKVLASVPKLLWQMGTGWFRKRK